MAISPNGATAYVVTCPIRSNPQLSAKFITVNLLSGATVSDVPISGPGACARTIAITPDGSTAYVGGQFLGLLGTSGVTYDVLSINLADDEPGAPITWTNETRFGPVAIAITPNGSTAYVADSDGTVVPINTATDQAGTVISVGEVGVDLPLAIAITPDGSTAYVAELDAKVVPISTATDQAGAAISVGGSNEESNAIAITPDGSTAYVANFAANNVFPINTATDQAGTAIALGADSYGPVTVAVTPDGATAYVATETDGVQTDATNVVPINTATGQAGKASFLDDLSPVAVARYPPSAGWTAQATTPNATTSAGPAVAQYNGAVYVAYKAASSGDIFYNHYNAGKWSTPEKLEGSWGSAETTAAPALVFLRRRSVCLLARHSRERQDLVLRLQRHELVTPGDCQRVVGYGPCRCGALCHQLLWRDLRRLERAERWLHLVLGLRRLNLVEPGQDPVRYPERACHRE
jgi:DNA-binding beta-propeller fold protein YncE